MTLSRTPLWCALYRHSEDVNLMAAASASMNKPEPTLVELLLAHRADAGIEMKGLSSNWGTDCSLLQLPAATPALVAICQQYKVKPSDYGCLFVLCFCSTHTLCVCRKR